MTVTAESLLRAYFLPLYPEDARSDRYTPGGADASPNPMVRAHIEDAASIFVANAPPMLWAKANELDLDYSDASVHRLSAAVTKARRDAMMESGAPGAPNNALFNFVVHGTFYLGGCLVRTHGAVWAVNNPLWESYVFHKWERGEAHFPIFHWWLKSLADDSPSTIADRYRMHVENALVKPEDLPVLAEPTRNLPRLKRPRYDSLYKYIKAHLPELRDVGEDFPSPERFEEMRFEYLAFTLVGDGRMLVMHGPNEHGLHAFWLSKPNGFEKSAFWAADKFPESLLRKSADDEKLEVVLSIGGKVSSFEIFWWGP